MDTHPTGLLKRRDIRFRTLDPGAHDTAATVQLLLEVNGIERVHIAAQDCLHVHYDLRLITLQMIESALREIGLQLEDTLVANMKRALFYYLEETQLINLSHDHSQAHSTLDVFINCYQQRQHGCRDGRPAHLRQYS